MRGNSPVTKVLIQIKFYLLFLIIQQPNVICPCTCRRIIYSAGLHSGHGSSLADSASVQKLTAVENKEGRQLHDTCKELQPARLNKTLPYVKIEQHSTSFIYCRRMTGDYILVQLIINGYINKKKRTRAFLFVD